MSQQKKKPQQNTKPWSSIGDRDEDHIHLPPPERRRVKPREATGKP